MCIRPLPVPFIFRTLGKGDSHSQASLTNVYCHLSSKYIDGISAQTLPEAQRTQGLDSIREDIKTKKNPLIRATLPTFPADKNDVLRL